MAVQRSVAARNAALDAFETTVGTAPLLMSDPRATARMVRAACALVGVDTPALAGPA